jgi:aryl-alcohol dehydrogenase-like predicted oxidoreductase
MIPQRPLGHTGLSVSVLGFGGASIGFANSGREQEFVSLVRRALELGINFFDTAPEYRRSEELLGEALRDHRAEVVLATKVGRVQTWDGYSWDSYEDWSEEGVRQTIELSLRRLQTDCLDLVQLHSPPRWVLDDGAALRGLQRAQAVGQVRHIGVSADGAEAWRALKLGAFATLQVSYSILQQEPGADLLPAAVERDMGVIVKQPVANGIAEMPKRPPHPDWAWKWDVAQQMNWTELGASDASRRSEFALRWLLANPLVSTAIVGTTRLDHLEANVAAVKAGPLDAARAQRTQALYFEARRKT